MTGADRKHLLLICDYGANSAGTIVDHVLAFPRYSRHRIWVLNRLGDLPVGLKLERFDGIIIHYSIVISHDHFLTKRARAAIRHFRGFKAVFVQDDYRWINRTVAAMAYLRVNAIFCLAPQEIVDAVYSPQILPNVRKTTVLAGYVPEALTRIEPKPYGEREIDVGYRARKLSAWVGSHAQEKWQIADRFLRDAPRYGLICDISCREEDRIYGDRWIEFLRNCRAVLGTESGSSVCDFTGEIQRQVEAHERRDPNVSFETLRDLYFKDVDGKIMMNVVSPRCFEAAALRTLMILYEGKYSGTMVPWRHYVPLRKDHSNMDEVVAVLRDSDRWSEIVERAYREVALNPQYTYRAMVERFDQVASDMMSTLPGRSHTAYDEAGFAKACSLSAAFLGGDAVIGVQTLAKQFERRLQGWLATLVAPIRSRRLRSVLRCAYFSMTTAVARAYTAATRVSTITAALVGFAMSPTLWQLWRLRLRPKSKAALLWELHAVREIERFAFESDAFELRVWSTQEDRTLRIEGYASSAFGGRFVEGECWDRLAQRALRGQITRIRWRMHDEWVVAPRWGGGDEREFTALGEALRSDPDGTVSLLRSALSRIATSPSDAVATRATAQHVSFLKRR